MNNIVFEEKNKLLPLLRIATLLTVFFSFWNDSILAITLPGVGEVFPFRVLLAITVVLYVAASTRGYDNPLRSLDWLYKVTYALIGLLFVVGCVSIIRAIDFSWTFRKFFNQTIDLCFFFMLLRLMTDVKLEKNIIQILVIGIAVMSILGIIEVFCGGIFNDAYNNYKRLEFFNSVYQFPIVSYGNTNDYVMSLFMCFSVVLLYFANRWKNIGKCAFWFTALYFGVLFFLCIASSSRLVKCAYFILLAGFTLFLLIADRKRIWIIGVIAVLILICVFGNQFKQISKSFAIFRAEQEAYLNSPSGSTAIPSFHIETNNKESLDEQFFDTNPVSGEKVLKDTGSAGARASLLLHSFRCFRESYGLGVGLGNTEQLAGIQKIAHSESGVYYTSIHCFIARLIADYGIFALIPLCIIGFCLIKNTVISFVCGFREKDSKKCAFSILFFFVLLTYPIASTASSDAQDCIAMWIFLATIFVTSVKNKEYDNLYKSKMIGE